jgi:DNA-binding response OmpR family regulator
MIDYHAKQVGRRPLWKRWEPIISEEAVSRARIFVVDDDEPILRLVNLTLAGEGYECLPFSSAPEALSLLDTESPDLVILDFRLPVMDGPTFYRTVREKGYAGPVLFLTALDRDDSVLEQFEDEGDTTSLLFKPFDPDDLISRVATLLGNTAS